MRKSTRLVALGSAVCAVLGTLTFTFASPARANHVYSPACDALRAALIGAQTALNQANDTLDAAQVAVNNATANLLSAANQLQMPTFNLIKAQENNVGVPTAQAAFDSALTFFNAAVANYVSALTQRVTLEATRDVNAQVIPFLQGVIADIDGVFPACVP